MMQDIKRICENPTEEDKYWFPELANTNWLTSLDFAMRNFKDESFIAQYLSPKLIRELRLFAVLDDDSDDNLVISAIHNEVGYQAIRSALSKQYNLSEMEPNVQVVDVDIQGDRTLTLLHTQHNRRPLAEGTEQVLKHMHHLWEFPVRLMSYDASGQQKIIAKCP